MKPLYCYFTQERSFQPPILHVSDLKTEGKENTPFATEAEFRVIMETEIAMIIPHSKSGSAWQKTKCDRVMFYFGHMPQRAVPVEKIDSKMLKRLFRPFLKLEKVK